MVVLKEGSRPLWVSLGASVWVQIAAGNSYTFPLYSPSLKSVLGFNQLQLTFLGVANDIGENIGILPGLACNKLPPWAILLVGVCASFFGYGVLWLAVSQTVQALPFWVLWISLCIATHGSAWLGTAVLVTNMRNFPISRGAVAGILKGYVGLSAAVFTEVYTMALNGSASNLLLLLTLGIPVIGLLMMYFIRPCTPASGEDSAEHCHFLFTQAASLFLAVYLLSTTILKDLFSFSNNISYLLIAIMIVLLMAPLSIPLKMTVFPPNPKRPGISTGVVGEDGYTNETDPLLTPSSSTAYLGSFYEPEDIPELDLLLAVGEGAVKKKRKPRRGEDFRFREAVVKADFWLLWSVYFLGVGSGVTVLNNLAQIGVSLGVNDATVLLSLFSFCNFLGRLGAGVVSEHFVRSKTIPRTFCLAVAQALMVVSFLLYASALSGTLYAATALLGICFGTQFGVMIPTASELFGLKDFGVIFNFMQLGNPVGALVFSSLLASQVYESEAAKQSGSSCMGPSCFRLTFLVLAGFCGLGTLVSIVLSIRIRPVYQMLYAGGYVGIRLFTALMRNCLVRPLFYSLTSCSRRLIRLPDAMSKLCKQKRTLLSKYEKIEFTSIYLYDMLHIYSTRFAIHGSFFLREKGNAIDEDWFQSPKLRPKRKTGEEFASDERLNRGERMIEYVMKRGKCVKEGRLLNRQKGIFILER